MSYAIMIRFPDEMRQPLQAAALSEERSVNWIVRKAVQAWLAARPTPIPTSAQSASSEAGAPLSPRLSAPREAQAASAE